MPHPRHPLAYRPQERLRRDMHALHDWSFDTYIIGKIIQTEVCASYPKTILRRQHTKSTIGLEVVT